MAGSLMTRGRRLRREEGGVLVEFALVVPILLVIFAGIIDFGLMMQRREVVTNAAREGARIAVLPNYALADVQARVNAYLNNGLATGASANATTTMTNVSIPVSTGPAVQARQVEVAYTSSYTILGPVMSLVGGSNFGAITLRARSTMRMEVPGP
jgi:Flp pilus assembly protein TadG